MKAADKKIVEATAKSAGSAVQPKAKAKVKPAPKAKAMGKFVKAPAKQVAKRPAGDKQAASSKKSRC